MDSIHIDSPWFKGDTTEIGDSPLLGMVKQFQLQIQSFIDKGDCPNVERAKKDIEGYQLLIDSGSDNNVREFLKLKHGEATGTLPMLANNVMRVQYLKTRGLWNHGETSE